MIVATVLIAYSIVALLVAVMLRVVALRGTDHRIAELPVVWCIFFSLFWHILLLAGLVECVASWLAERGKK